MRLLILLFLVLLFPYAIVAQNIPKDIFESIKSSTDLIDGVHTVDIKNRLFEVYIHDKGVRSIKRRIVQNELLNDVDSEVLAYLEEAYAAHLLSIDNPKFDDIEIIRGNWNTFENLHNVIECSLVYNELMQVTLSLKSDTDELCVSFSVDYQKFNNGSRAEMENEFIEDLLSYKVTESRHLPVYSKENLVDVGNNNFLLKGSTYLIPTVNRNSYLSKNDEDSLYFITNRKQPIATFSNMVVTGIGYCATLNMSILTHEYGSKAMLSVPLEQFIQYCIHTGCEVYWGYDKLELDILYGTIFCYNPKQGYEHIVHLQCDTSNLGEENFEIDSRVSLFIPTTNTQNNFQLYNGN